MLTVEGGTDLKYARTVADHIGSHHSEVYFTAEDGVNALDEVIYATETWDTTTFVLQLVNLWSVNILN